MNVLIDLNHPAHVHLFRNFIIYLKRLQHKVFISATDKDVTINLLKSYDLEPLIFEKPAKKLFRSIGQLINRDIKLNKINKNMKWDVAFGTSVVITHLSIISNIKSFFFNEDDDAVVPIAAYLSYPFSTKIVNPDCLKYSKWKNKRVIHNSYHELAYLHPNNFTPDKEILKKYNLKEKEYIIMRFSAFQAHHDIGAKGISKDLAEKIENIFSKYTIIKTIENSKTHKIEPLDMHHVLAFSKMIISDSQTMTIEGSVLGIPSIRINTFIGKSTVIDELEKKYKLAYGFFPTNENEIINTLYDLLNYNNLENEWGKRRDHLLSEKCDFNQWMIDYFEKEINK